jgi:hypothetical protein
MATFKAHCTPRGCSFCGSLYPLQPDPFGVLCVVFTEALKEGFKVADGVILATPDPGIAAAAEKGATSLGLDAIPEVQLPSNAFGLLKSNPPVLSADHDLSAWRVLFLSGKASVASSPARRLNKSNGGLGDHGRLHIGQVSTHSLITLALASDITCC